MSISNLTHAIGDIHGRFDLLSSLLDFIQSDADRRHQEPKVIFLGDIIDRGPNSKDCIELVTLTLKRWPKSRLMLGNHDDYFLQVMGTESPDPKTVAFWLRNGAMRLSCTTTTMAI